MKLIGFVASIVTVCIIFLVAVVGIVSVNKCEHTRVETVFSFSSYDSTGYYDYFYVRCDDCYEKLKQTLFHKEPADTSYLRVFEQFNNGNDLVRGEYYTIRGTVSLKFYDLRPSEKLRIRCQVEVDGIIVGFSIEFREEFRERVKLLEEGDEVTFRGKFYDIGCGFSDAELITE